MSRVLRQFSFDFRLRTATGHLPPTTSASLWQLGMSPQAATIIIRLHAVRSFSLAAPCTLFAGHTLVIARIESDWSRPRRLTSYLRVHEMSWAT